MKKYRHQITGEVKELPFELIAAWKAANNPKLDAWVELPPEPEPVAQATSPSA